FFFFQAEDGIRDRNVTGVQTCALPILPQKTVRVRQAHPRSLGRDAASSDWVCLQGWPDSILRMCGEVVQDIAPSLWVGPCRGTEIGRASCRERGEGSGGGMLWWRAQER